MTVTTSHLILASSLTSNIAGAYYLSQNIYKLVTLLRNSPRRSDEAATAEELFYVSQTDVLYISSEEMHFILNLYHFSFTLTIIINPYRHGINFFHQNLVNILREKPRRIYNVFQ